MSLAVCTNHDCKRVLDVPGLPRTYRARNGECAKCAGLTPEQIMDIPSQVLAALRPIASHMQIEHDIPLPTSGRGRYGTCWLPLDQMGKPRADGTLDSVLVPCPEDMPPEKHATHVRTTCTKWAKKHDVKFTTREEETGVRIWRTA